MDYCKLVRIKWMSIDFKNLQTIFTMHALFTILIFIKSLKKFKSESYLNKIAYDWWANCRQSMASQLHRRGVEFDSVTALYKETSYVDQEQDANIALSELDKGHLSESLHLYAVIVMVYQTLIYYNNLHYFFRYFL